MLKLDLIHTLAFGGVVLFLGYAIRRAIPVLARYNLPAPVIGGLVVSLVILAARQWHTSAEVTDAANTCPIVITSPAHTLSNGDAVTVTGVLGNPAANGTFTVAKTTSNTFELQTSKGDGAYAGGGVCTSALTLLRLDTTLQNPLMIAFFTTIGFGASFGLLKKGGPLVLLFFGLSTAAAVLQNVVGAAAALALGQSPLFGVLCGSVTLTGGPGTGLAFAPQFESAGVSGAGAIALAAAMIGIVAGGLIGSPIGTLLIEQLHRKRAANANLPTPTATQVVEAQLPAPPEQVPVGEDVGSYVLLKNVGLILVAMWAGSWVGAGITALGVTLPAYIGAMLVAMVLRNLDDVTGWLGLSQEAIDEIGNVALSFFLVVALMTLELWKLAAVALPLLIILVVQVVLVAVYCLWPIFPWMGRDYDAAVMSGGFCGFMLGTTANAMANMDALVRRYGPSPRAFLVVPMVGAFFIDFVNALLIQGCLNLFS